MVLRVASSCNLERIQRFEGTRRLHIQGRSVSEAVASSNAATQTTTLFTLHRRNNLKPNVMFKFLCLFNIVNVFKKSVSSSLERLECKGEKNSCVNVVFSGIDCSFETCSTAAGL